MNDLFSANGVTIFRDQNPFKQLRSMSNARVTKKNEKDGQNERKTDKITAGQKDKQNERYAGIKTDEQNDRKTDKIIARQKDKWKERYADKMKAR